MYYGKSFDVDYAKKVVLLLDKVYKKLIKQNGQG